MITITEAGYLGMCLEGFFYGLYSGIFAMYLQRPPNKTRTATILFYALCLLYVLSTAAIVGDLVTCILETRFSTQSEQLQIETESLLFRLTFVQAITSGCCDFLAQCILIYRCWIVWGQNIYVTIIPSILAITYLATWLATAGATTFSQGQIDQSSWGDVTVLISFSATMAVNTLVTGLIAFRIIKVFLEFKPTSIEKSLGSTTEDTNLRHVIFVIIESGMTLLAIQLVRFVLFNLPDGAAANAYNLVIGINVMLCGITPTIILVRVAMKLSFDDKESFKEAAESLRFKNPASDPGTLQEMGPQDSASNEDICFNDPLSDLNTLQRVGNSSMPLQEKSEDICFNDPPLADNPNTNGRMGSMAPEERSGDT